MGITETLVLDGGDFDGQVLTQENVKFLRGTQKMQIVVSLVTVRIIYTLGILHHRYFHFSPFTTFREILKLLETESQYSGEYFLFQGNYPQNMTVKEFPEEDGTKTLNLECRNI